MNQFEIVQTLLLRNGAEELLLTKLTYPDQSHFYALAHAIDAKQGLYASIPLSLKRMKEIRDGKVA